MFEYRYPLLEVVQAIEELRESRGTTNKQICDFVRQQGRNPNDPMKILKTIRTLNKLVEEGVLIKKGKRYVFPTKPPELSDNMDENEQDDGEQDQQEDNQEADSCEEDEGDDEGEEGEEGEDEEEQEEEDDDDDDDDEEEDDDDDDEDEDEECEDNEQIPEPDNSSASCPEDSTSKGLSQQKSLNSGEPKPTENVGANEERTDKITPKTSENIVSKKNSLKGGKKNGKGQNCGEAKNNNGKNKGGEAIAFCARDFIDSQYSQNSTQAKPVALHKKPQDDLIEIENYENEPIARAFGMRKRESKSRKSRAGNDCRSRSPIRGNGKSSFFTDLALDHSGDLRKNMISSQIFQEVTDTPMDIDHDNEVVDLDYDILRHRSPIGPPSPITPGVLLNRTESCCSQPNTKSPENIKAELDFDCKNQFFLKKNAEFKHSRHSMARVIDMQNKRLAAKEAAEKDKEKHKRELCSDDGNGIKAEKRTSLCSVCEKKKRNS